MPGGQKDKPRLHTGAHLAACRAREPYGRGPGHHTLGLLPRGRPVQASQTGGDRRIRTARTADGRRPPLLRSRDPSDPDAPNPADGTQSAGRRPPPSHKRRLPRCLSPGRRGRRSATPPVGHTFRPGAAAQSAGPALQTRAGPGALSCAVVGKQDKRRLPAQAGRRRSHLRGCAAPRRADPPTPPLRRSMARVGASPRPGHQAEPDLDPALLRRIAQVRRHRHLHRRLRINDVYPPRLATRSLLASEAGHRSGPESAPAA